MRKLAFLLLLAALIFFSCDTGEEPPADSPIVIEVPEDLLGLAGSAGDGEEYAWDTIKELKATWVARMFRWSEFQKNRGAPDDPASEWHWGLDDYVRNMNQLGVKILGTIGCSDMEVYTAEDLAGRWPSDPGHYVPESHFPSYKEYVRRIVEHYSFNEDPDLRVHAWEIWNEGNWADWWSGEPVEFYKLHKATAEAVREVDPNIPLMGFNPNHINYDDWSRNLINGGYAPRDKIDGAAFHPYSSNPTTTLDTYNTFKSIVATGGFSEIWVTEVGFPTGGNNSPFVMKQPQQSASYTAPTIALLAANGVAKILWYEFSENGGTNGHSPAYVTSNDFEDFFGLTWWWRDDADSDDWHCWWQDSAFAYQLCGTYISGYTYRSNLPERVGIPAAVKALYFEKGVDRTLVLWNTSIQMNTVNVTLPGTDRTLHDMNVSTWDKGTGAQTDPKFLKPVPHQQSVGETTTVTLNTNIVKFYTWKNTGNQVPQISAP